jgi:hypothetical protein
MEEDYESKLEQCNGTYFALRLANIHLASRLHDLEKERHHIENELNGHKLFIVTFYY